MRILINHLTRMQKGCVCAAGIELNSGRHVRPVLYRQLPTDLLASQGGPFDLGRIVELGDARFFGRVPEVEDHLFELEQLQFIEEAAAEVFWNELVRAAKSDLHAIFGSDLQLFAGRTFVVEETYGLRSLGCYWASKGRLVTETRGEQIKLRFAFSWAGNDSKAGLELSIPVTDIRLFLSDHVTPDLDRVAELDRRLARQEQTLVSIGLTRPYKLSSEEPARHWLQLNNIHFSDDPLWGRLQTPDLLSPKNP